MTRALFAVVLIVVAVYLSGAHGQDLTYSLEPVPSSGLEEFSFGDDLYWGLSVFLNVTPEWDDLLTFNASLINNTVLRYTFATFPPVVRFTPNDARFSVIVAEGVETISGPEDVTFEPEFRLVRFAAVNMNASYADPIWNLNITSPAEDPFAPAYPEGEDVYLSWSEECLQLNGITCDGVVSASIQNETGVFLRPKLRELVLNHDGQGYIDKSLQALTPGDMVGITVLPFAASRPIIVHLPLQDGDSSSFDDPSLLAGSTDGDEVRALRPGRDNAGGNLTVSLYSAWLTYEYNDTVSPIVRVDGLVTLFPSSITIDANSAAGSFLISADLPWTYTVGNESYTVDNYFLYWRVVESSQNLSLTTDAGWPQGAYFLNPIRLSREDIDFQFLDVDLDNGPIIPISPRKTGSYRYHVAVDRSPLDMGMGANGTITYAFEISPPGAFRILVASTSSPSSFAPVTAFVWTGAQTIIEFILDTQDFPTDIRGANWTFTDPVFNPPRDLDAFSLLPSNLNLAIVPNMMEISVTNNFGNGRLEDGITPGQPFWMLFEWTPPTTNGFVISLSASGVQYPDGSTGEYFNTTVAAGLTSILLGPFVALEATNLDNTAGDMTTLVFNVGLNNLTTGPSDNYWFVVNSPVLVTVRRDRLYLLNNVITREISFRFPEGEKGKKRDILDATNGLDLDVYELSSNGFVSEQFCIGTSLNSRFFSNGQQEIWVTPYAETLALENNDEFAYSFQDRAGLLFSAVNNPAPAAGVSRAGMPPGTVVLSRANNATGCFVVAFDRNWPFLSSPLNLGASLLGRVLDENNIDDPMVVFSNGLGIWRISIAIGGPNSGLVFERDIFGAAQLLRLPYFTVRKPSVDIRVLGSRPNDDGWDYLFYAGDEPLVYITLSEPAPVGLNYALTCTACQLIPVETEQVNSSPGFTSGSLGPHVWRIIFTALPVPFGSAMKRALEYQDFTTMLHFWAHGSDAAYYVPPSPIELALQPRSVSVDHSSCDTTVFIGLDYAGVIVASIRQPPLSSLTVVPVPLPAAGVLQFTPSEIVFTPDGPLSVALTVSVDTDAAPYSLGTWYWMYRLEGPDANVTVLDDGQGAHSITVERRPRAEILGLPDTFIAGVTYGPVVVQLTVPLLPGEGPDGLVFTPSSSEFTFTPSSIVFQPGQMEQVMSVRWDPTPGTVPSDRVNWFWTMSGDHAWKYEMFSSVTYDSDDFELRLRSIRAVDTFYEDEDQEEPPTVYMGVTYESYLELQYPTPLTVTVTPVCNGITFSPSTIQFTSTGGLRQFFTFTVDDDLLGPLDAQTVYVIGGEDADYYTPISPKVYRVRPNKFIWDANTDGHVMHKFFDDHIFMLNQPTPMFSVSLIAAPQTSVTVTFTSEYLTFRPASLVFTPGVLTQSFSFTPIRIPATQIWTDGESIIQMVSVRLSGPDADKFDVSDLEDVWREDILIIPEIDVSPIRPMYPDGSSEAIIVSLKNNGTLASSLPDGVGNYNGFTIRIVASVRRIYAEPSVLEFSSATVAAPLRTFRLQSFAPEDFDETHFHLTYYITFAGNRMYSEPVDITQYLPNHATQVQLKYYNIIPIFPNVLSYGWQEASFNLTRAPRAHLVLVPHMPILDGQDSAPYGGHSVAAGRLHFDPPIISFSPGQMVSSFLVKAMHGVENAAEAAYYRIDWEMVGDASDLTTYLEFIAPRTSSGGTHFATWHVATAVSLAQISIAAVLCLALVLAL